MKEIVDYFNSSEIEQKSMDFEEDIPLYICNKYFLGSKCLATEIDIDKRRWYETSISVYEFPEGLLGVRHVAEMYSEQMSVIDIGHTLIFSEMEEFTKVSYKQKS